MQPEYTTPAIAIPYGETEQGRWEAWQADGVRSARRQSKIMTGMFMVVGVAIAIWLSAQLMLTV